MPSQDQLERAGHELKVDPPRVLAKTRRKKGAKAANRQRVAIMFSKSRAAERKRAAARKGARKRY